MSDTKKGVRASKYNRFQKKIKQKTNSAHIPTLSPKDDDNHGNSVTTSLHCQK